MAKRKTSKAGKKRQKKAAKKGRTGRRAKKKGGEHFKTLSVINEKLTHLEKQALKAYECVQAVKKRSSPDWKDWVDKLSKQDWLALADAQRERVAHEIKHLSDEILSKIHDANVLSNKDTVLTNAKKSLEDIVGNVQSSELVNKAIDTAIHTKDGLLAFLNIPTHEEMIKLQRKLSRLERKMNELDVR